MGESKQITKKNEGRAFSISFIKKILDPGSQKIGFKRGIFRYGHIFVNVTEFSSLACIIMCNKESYSPEKSVSNI